MSSRGITISANLDLVTEECINCGVLFAFPGYLRKRLIETRRTFYCPSGHQMSFTGKNTTEQQLREAEAREVHLRDQLEASAREAETVRVALVRDRHRFANGVCPCCNRYFPNVHGHMTTQHPDYDVTKVRQPTTTKFPCSCGSSFDSFRGLRIHQGQMRDEKTWFKPETPKGRTWGGSHLTVV